jgi:hypothetical protein
MGAVRAGAVAALFSGAPSTAWALARGRDPLAAARAAGTLVPGRRHRPNLLGGVAAHLVISAVWTAVFALVARRRPWGPASGALAGLAIAGLDLGVVGRRYPAIAALPLGPQLADHAAFGALLGGAMRRATAARSSSCPSG